MKILIINQPLNNRGDESAHKALVRRLVKEYPDYEFTVLFGSSAKEDSIRQFTVKSPNVRYVRFSHPITKGFAKVSKCGLRYNLHFLWFLHPGIRSWLRFFRETDYVICAPGGIDMGGFQFWHHIFNLYCAKLSRKPTAYYGRSIGPFPTATSDNRKFKEISTELLRYFTYISLRDKKSEEEAKNMGIEYTSVVDSAFLDSPYCEVPQTVCDSIGERPFFVFVPDLLIWHFAYKDKATKEDSISFYTKILDVLFSKYPDHVAVMLPQTFNYDSYLGNDVNFMREIARNYNSGKVAVIDDVYSSDIQQTIISKSSFIVGARYHSVVFAINNSVPFIALSYEHKMEGLLETLGLKDSMVDITKVFDGKNIQDGIISKIEDMLPLKPFDRQKTLFAKEIAENGFGRLKEKLAGNVKL